MSIALTSVYLKHERRVQLSFSNTLASGAFTTLSYYTVKCTNDKGQDPTVEKAFALLASPSVVELQLAADLAPGGIYEFRADGVPCTDLSVTPVDSLVYATFGEAKPGLETTSASPLDAVLYGVDLRFEGNDFVETNSGDLATLSGPPLVRRDLWNRLMSDGLLWDDGFGVKVRELVDAPILSSGIIRGRVLSQVMQDDRVKKVRVNVETSEDGTASVVIEPELIGDSSLSTIEPIKYEGP